MKHTPHAVRFACALACTLIAAATLAPAGPLNPPAGAIASSGKTLTEVEPRTIINATNTPGDANCTYRITQPGSYYLTGNLVGVSGKDGIWIDANGVTIDLRGFHVLGSGPGGGAKGFRLIGGNDSNVSLLNGTVRNWASTGVDFSLNVMGGRIEGVHAFDNGGYGIDAGANAAVVNCSAVNNGTDGIRIGHGGAVLNCTASSNDREGFSIGSNTAVSNCTAGNNTDSGFAADWGTTLTNCTATSNREHGFDLDEYATVIDSSATYNDLDGVNCQNGCTIRGCTLNDNGGLSTVGAGVRTSGTQNRIEGNNCTNNDFGLYITGTGNIITRNTCSGSTQNFVISAGNVHGPVVDRTAPGGATIVGNSGAGTMGTTDTNANFAY